MADLGRHMTVTRIIAIILGIIGLIWLIYALWRNWKINKISTWPKANATVIASVAEPANDEAGNTYVDPNSIVATTDSGAQYIPRVVYRYRVGNQDYQSNNVVYAGQSTYGPLGIKALLGQINQGSTIPVYYNPGNHAESYIYNGLTSYTGVIIGLVLLLIGLLLGFYDYKKQTKPVTYTTETITTRKNVTATPNLSDMDSASKPSSIKVTTSKTTIPGIKLY